MTTFIIFLIISISTFLLLYFKIAQMKEMGTLGHALGEATGVDKKYRPFLDKAAYFLAGLKWLLWIIVPVILFFIWIISWALSYLVDLGMFLISIL